MPQANTLEEPAPQTPHIIRRGELDIVQIDNAACSAEVSLFGGHVMNWHPSGQKPVLWMSKTAASDAKTALRGGIPICWPWFGPVEGKGRHGLVRNRNWKIEHYKERSRHTELDLSIELTDAENPWPHPNRLLQKLVFGRTLQQTLVMENHTSSVQCFAYALHNYFKVSNPANVAIPDISNTLYDDKISNESQLIDQGDQAYTGPIDRIYQCDASAEVIDTGYKRKIVIEKFGSQHWVLWNPGSDAANLSDVHEGGEDSFLCFEAANTADIIVPAGSQIEVGQVISVEANA